MTSRILLSLLIFAGALNAQISDVVNGGSFQRAMTTGSWATAFGVFTGVTNTTGTIPVAKNLGGVTINVASIAAPVYFVSTNQINFLIPNNAPQGVQTLEIKVGSNTFTKNITILSAAPGLFPQDVQTPPRASVINQNNTVNAQNSPALRGDVISLYATGAGAYKLAVTDGAAPGTPLNESKSTPQVFIAGIAIPASDISFSGLHPLYPGLWQINIKVPSQSFVTGRVPIVIYQDGVMSNEAAIYVQ